MIAVYSNSTNLHAAELVRYGFIRAYTRAQVSKVITDGTMIDASIYVFVKPGLIEAEIIKIIVHKGVKIIVLGDMPESVQHIIGVVTGELPDSVVEWDSCPPAQAYSSAESSARVVYDHLPDDLHCPIYDRPLLRYDFAAEWNNLGYGHVRTDGSIWALACKAVIAGNSIQRLASVHRDGDILTEYATLTNTCEVEILWINRLIGLIDSQEFRLIETFVSNYKPDALPCLPLIREVPYGYDGCCTMRLDCDESIVSAGALFDLYRERGVPFSLAVKTGQDIGENDFSLMREVMLSGGALLSHSVSHKQNWGVDEQDVMREAADSRDWMLSNIPGLREVNFAVSPFHQNPDYAVSGLSHYYDGFIGGIICNDPQYLLARGGEVCGIEGIVSHSQQCMLHGDCVLQPASQQMDIYRQAAQICFRSGAIMGYLDHPFSSYQYGWETELQRVSFHKDWLDYLQSCGNVLFLNECDAMRHIVAKSAANIWLERGEIRCALQGDARSSVFAYEYMGEICALSS